MRVRVDDDVFTQAADTAMELVELLNMGRHKRHRILLGPPPHDAYQAWTAARQPAERELFKSILEQCLDAESRTPADLGIRIVADARANAGADPTFLLHDALQLLRAQFRVVLENHLNDRAFLMAAASDEDRAVLEEAEERNWLRFDNGGGLEGIVSMLSANTPGGLASERSRLRAFILFDSDRLAPATEAKKSDPLARQCASCGLDVPRRYHQLRRRAIENYLPVEALERWQQSPKGRPDRPAVVSAWRQLDPQQAHHFNMKHGFDRDRPRLAKELPAELLCSRDGKHYVRLYESLPDDVLHTLRLGFDEAVGQDFKKNLPWFTANPSWRHRAGVAEEVDELLDALLGVL